MGSVGRQFVGNPENAETLLLRSEPPWGVGGRGLPPLGALRESEKRGG